MRALLDSTLTAYRLDALIRPTAEPAFRVDTVRGDSIGGSASGEPAMAGYPHLTVPMGQVRGLPVGVSFMGAKWDDARILALGYAYEQASHRIMAPRFLPSIEESPEVAPHLRPAGR
jgi:amidase